MRVGPAGRHGILSLVVLDEAGMSSPMNMLRGPKWSRASTAVSDFVGTPREWLMPVAMTHLDAFFSDGVILCPGLRRCQHEPEKAGNIRDVCGRPSTPIARNEPPVGHPISQAFQNWI
jgi:hypothetical protein